MIELVRPHLGTGDCLIVTGYQDFLSTLAILLREVPDLARHRSAPETDATTPPPAPRLRLAFGVDTANAHGFTGRGLPADEVVRRHFLQTEGLLVEDAADLQAVLAAGAIRRGEIALRLFDAARGREVLGLSGDRRLHAKIVTSPLGGVAGSANFSRAGLWQNVEYADAVRLDASPVERGLAQARIDLAERIWQASTDWTEAALEILQALLRPVSAEDAVCRLLAEQRGFAPWRIDRHPDPKAITGFAPLPHQVELVYEASSIVWEHGFAMLSAPPGAGKTDIGKHLAWTLSTSFRRAVGGETDMARVGAVVVAPPKVSPNWRHATRDLHVIPSSELPEVGRLGARDGSRASFSGPATGPDVRDLHARRLREAGVLILDESHTVTPGFDSASRRAEAIEAAPPSWTVCLSATLMGNRDVDWLTHLQEKRASLFLSPPHVAEMRAIFARELARREAAGLFAEPATDGSDGEGLSPETRAELAAMLAPCLTHRQRACINAAASVAGEPGTGHHHGPRYPELVFHGRPKGLTPTPAQARRLDQIVAHLGQLAPGRRLTSVTLTRFGIAAERRHNQNTLYARNLLNILRVSSAQALWQMRHGAIGRNLRRFEIEEAARLTARAPTADTRQGDLFAGTLPDIASRRHATPKCDALIAALDSHSLRALDARRLEALADLQGRHRRIVVLAERVATLQIHAEGLTRRGSRHDGQKHTNFVIATGQMQDEDDPGIEGDGGADLLRDLYGPEAPSFRIIRKGTDIEAVFRHGGRKAPSGPATAFMTYQMAEGINLQSADALVALGLTANIRELLQGLGRIDRIDSPHRRIHYYLVDIPVGRIASDEKAVRRLDNYRALTAQPVLADAEEPGEGTDSTATLGSVFAYLQAPRVLRDNNFHDLLAQIDRMLPADRLAEIAGMRIDGLWGADLSVVAAPEAFTLIHLRGERRRGGAGAPSFAPPRLLMIDAQGTLLRNQIACATALKSAYAALVAGGAARTVPDPERLQAALERIGPQLSQLKEWDLRPERSLSCLETLAGFIAPALDVGPAVGDLDEQLFGSLSLQALEHLSEAWLRALEPWWTRAKRDQRASFVAGGASGYLTLQDVARAMESDLVAADRLRQHMLTALAEAREMSGAAPRSVAQRIAVVLVALPDERGG